MASLAGATAFLKITLILLCHHSTKYAEFIATSEPRMCTRLFFDPRYPTRIREVRNLTSRLRKHTNNQPILGVMTENRRKCYHQEKGAPE